MFRLYQSNRLERLAGRLAEVMRAGNPSPFVAEEVVVPHPGMGRWLALRLAERQGVCANVRFPLPGAFIWDLFRRLFPDEISASSGFEPEVLVWRLAGLLETLPDEPVFAPLHAYLAHADERMRHELAQRIAEAFDQYLVYRPDWILQWERGNPAAVDDAWQAALWQRLAGQGGARHWVYWQQRFFDMLETGGLDTRLLPARLTLFAIQTLSPGYLRILQRLAEHIDIHLFLLNPSEGHWTETVSESVRARREAADGSAALYVDVGNPLLSSLGGQGRDFFASILELDPGSEELFEAPAGENLLARLQDDILQLRPPEEGVRIAAEAICADTSIQIHTCHSPMREMEVLQDQLLSLFERHPGLAPHQVLVMTPDIATYAPYIEAVFGEPGDRPQIPYQLADRPGLDAAPLVRAFLDLLRMPLGRFEADRPLAVLEVAAVQRRFGLEEGDMPRIIRWVRDNAIRWGRDAVHRRRFGHEDGGGNSWSAGLDRLLLGYALGDGEEGRLFGGLAPYAGIEGGAARVMGILQEFMSRLFQLARRLETPRPMADWVTLLLETLDLFLQPEAEEEAQLQTLRDLLAELLAEAQAAGYESDLSLERILWLLEQRVGRVQGLGGFLRGGVTFSALTPQRSLPFEVICLVGMNDGSFPRDRHPPDFDLMQHHHQPGDRSRRADDRYLFLETLVSARRTLYISYVGQDARDNSELPPAVVVSELLDYLARLTPGPEERRKVRAEKVIRHPLQAFSRRYFDTGDGPLVAYSAELARAAQRLVEADKEAVPPLLDGPLPAPPELWDHPTLADLEEFFRNPVRFLLRRRIGVTLAGGAELPEVRDPTDLDRFEAEGWRDRMVAALLREDDTGGVRDWMRGAGVLPPGVYGDAYFERQLEVAEKVAERVRTSCGGETKGRLPVDLHLGDMTLSGELSGMGPTGLFGYRAGPLWDGEKVTLWLRHLCLNAAVEADDRRNTLWIDETREWRFQPVADARALLTDLLAIYRQGLQRPLHFFPGSGWAFMEGLGKGEEEAQKKARIKWYGNSQYAGEWARSPYYRLTFPDGHVLDDEFMALTRRIFGPLREHLEGG